MTYQEKPVVFPCQGEHLAGVIAEPALGMMQGDIGVVIVVGGPQYRVGSHRQFLLLSRSLAESGFPVLRFDVRGMGDSTGTLHTFEHITPDIAAAIDALQQHAPHVRRIVLWGLCDGASAALLYCQATADKRVLGVCALNPWVRSDASLARAHVKHYYGQRLRQKEFWVKLLSGQVAGKALAGLWRNLRTMGAKSGTAGGDRVSPFQQRMAQGWQTFDGQVLLLLSGEDYTAKEFLEYTAMDVAWTGLLDQPHVLRCDLPQADHTFSNAQARAQVAALTLDWLQSRVGA